MGIYFGNDSRSRLLSGVKLISNAVKATLGPSGRNVYLKDRSENRPYSTKDGVTVAGHIYSDDEVEQSAIQSIQSVASGSDSGAGDGTTTATVLAEAIFRGGLDAGKESLLHRLGLKRRVNLIDLRTGIDKGMRYLIKKLDGSAIIVSDDLERLLQIARISTNNDDISSKLVVDAYKVAGNQGIVNIGRSRTFESHLTVIEGMNLPMGFNSVYYVNDHEHELFEYDNCYLYVTNSRIDKLTPNLSRLLELVSELQAPILIICNGIDVSVTDILIRNKIENNFKVCVCKAPFFGEEQNDILRDLGIYMGRHIFLENEGLNFEDLDSDELLKYVPMVSSVRVSREMTSFKEPNYTSDVEEENIKRGIANRVSNLRSMLEGHLTSYERSNIQSRISRLTDGLAYINIGAHSDAEFIEKQHRIQDALYAVKAAAEEGVVIGGGVALYKASSIPPDFFFQNKDVEKGFEIVMEAAKEPFRQIMRNAGITVSKKHINTILSSDKAGIDARKREFCIDMFDRGIIDPKKVTRVALENACSIAGLMITTECVAIEKDIYKVEGYGG